MVELQYKSTAKLMISALKSKGGSSLKLPLMNYNTGKPLAESEQIITVSENEAGDLMRCWPQSFEVVKPKRAKKEEPEVPVVEN